MEHLMKLHLRSYKNIPFTISRKGKAPHEVISVWLSLADEFLQSNTDFVLQAKDFGGKFFSIHLHEHFLSEFIKVSQFLGVGQVQCMDHSKNHCASLGCRSNVVQDDHAFNKNSSVIIMSTFSVLLVDDINAHGAPLYVCLDVISFDDLDI